VFAQAWPELEEHPGDVVLLTKQFMHSRRLSQVPQAILPYTLLGSLPASGPNQCLAHDTLGPTVCREYLKTADKVERAPWHLENAAKYLRDLVQRSSEPPDPTHLPSIDFVKHHVRNYVPMPVTSVYERCQEYAPKSPKMVRVDRAPPGKRLRIRGKQVDPTLTAAVQSAQPPSQLGCPKCRWSVRGCAKCKMAAARKAADAAAAAAAAADPAAAAEAEPEAVADGAADAADGAAAEGAVESPPADGSGWRLVEPPRAAVDVDGDLFPEMLTDDDEQVIRAKTLLLAFLPAPSLTCSLRGHKDCERVFFPPMLGFLLIDTINIPTTAADGYYSF